MKAARLLLVASMALAATGCEKGEECKVGFDFEGKSHVVSWWVPEGGQPDKAGECKKFCAANVDAAKAEACAKACTDETYGCQKKSR